MKIIIFPFAGSNSYSFRSFQENIPNNISVRVIEYPGRGKKIKEPLIHNINTLVEQTIPTILEDIQNSPYIVFGHSLGALVGYLLCKKVSILKLPLPKKLIVSGFPSPSLASTNEKISHLNRESFWDKVNKYGGLTEGIINNKEIKILFEPILKADFKCFETYNHLHNVEKIEIPIDVFYGSEERVTKMEAEMWQEETTANITVTELKGGHFFIFDHQVFFTNYFKNCLLNATV